MSTSKDTIKTGYLTKSPPENKGPFYGWKRRFFMFIDSSRVYPYAPRHIRIEYYPSLEESKTGNPLNSINLNDCSGVLKREPLKGHKHVFDIVTSTRVFHLSADSNEDREDWVNLLNTNIFSFNNMKPVAHVDMFSNISFKQNKRSSGQQPEIDFSEAKQGSRGCTRSQSLRNSKTNSIQPMSPEPKPDMFFPLFPNAGNPNSYSSNLKMLPNSEPNSPPIHQDKLSFNDNEIISDPGFTAVPQSFGVYNESNSLVITNESPYINVGSHTHQGPPRPVSMSADSSPTCPMMPAPYKKFPPPDNSHGVSPPTSLPINEIESEYSCLDSSNIRDNVMVSYAKVHKNK